MNLEEYLKLNNINYVLGKVDKDKKFIPLPNNSYGSEINKCKFLFENQNQDYITNLMETNQELYNNGLAEYNTAFIDTNEYIQLDCDIKNDEEYEKLSQEGQNMLKNLLDSYPYYKSATKKYGYHFIICKTSDIANKKQKALIDNNSSICEYSNWVAGVDCVKLKSEFAFLEIFCGCPIWAKDFPNVVIENSKKKLNKTHTRETVNILFQTIFNKNFLENGGKVKVKKAILTEVINEIKINNKSDSDSKILLGIPTDKYYNNGYVFKLLIYCIWDKGVSVRDTLYNLGKQSPLATDNYDSYFNKLYQEGQTKSSKQSFGYAVNLCSRDIVYQDKINSNTEFIISNELLAQSFMDINEDNLLQVKNGESFDLYFYNNESERWANQTAQKFCSLIEIIRQFSKQYCKDIIKKIDIKLETLEDSEECGEVKQLSNIKSNINKYYVKQTNYDTDSTMIINMINQKRARFNNIEIDKFDNEIHLLPFANGVWNLKTHTFEKHNKKNYITKYINYEIYPESPLVNKYVEDFVEFYDELFTEEYKEVQADLTYILALGLTGLTSLIIPVFNGEGSNGKSVLFDYMELVLGEEYFIRFGGDMIGEDIKANKPSPEWGNIDKKRFGVFTETTEGTAINLATVKCLGEGSINARKLYSNNTKTTNFSNYIVMCNQKPVIRGTIDNSVDRRIVDIYLPRTFIQNPNDPKLINNPNGIYKLANNKYRNKQSDFVCENMKIGLLFYLLDYIREFSDCANTEDKTIFEIGQSFQFSEKTQESSKLYLTNENLIIQFIKDFVNLDLKNNEDYESYKGCNLDFITVDNLHNEFKKQPMYSSLENSERKSYGRKNFISALRDSLDTKDNYKKSFDRNKIKYSGNGGYLVDCYFKELSTQDNQILDSYKQLHIIDDSEEEDEEEEDENILVNQIKEEPYQAYDSDSDSD